MDSHPRTKIRRLWDFIRFPPPYEGPILSGRTDGAAYLLGWIATFAHITLWVVVLALGLHKPWETISTLASVVATLFLLTIVIVIHRRMGHGGKLSRDVVCSGGPAPGIPLVWGVWYGSQFDCEKQYTCCSRAKSGTTCAVRA